MFVLNKERLVKSWPVSVVLPADGGEVIKEKITLDLIIQDMQAGSQIIQGNMDIFKRAIVGWSDIEDINGNNLEFSEQNRELLFENPFFVMAAAKAYQQAANGVKATDL